MRVKDRFLEKINLLIFILSLSFSHCLYANSIYEEFFNYNSNLKNSSVNFIQTNINTIQEGVIFFGNKRIKIVYNSPQKISIILSEKKGMYINHELRETEFFSTKKSYIKVFFDVFHNKNQLSNMKIKKSNHHIEFNKDFQLDNILFNISVVYENEPIKLRRLVIEGNDEKIQMGFFDHNIEKNFSKNFFSMLDPYLN